MTDFNLLVSFKMPLVLRTVAAAALFAGVSASAASAADEFKLSSNQRISCNRSLEKGKLQTSTCHSYAYVFNTRTSEYYRCAAGLSVTKDNKDLMKIDTEGACQKHARIFPNDSSYSFDGAETEGPNTNSFFGPGGYVIWASDKTTLAVKACFIITVAGNDAQRCIEMKFE
ncbi:MAG: hypothetical protein ACLP8B_14835 [Xanthobacteraceae bacterium]